MGRAVTRSQSRVKAIVYHEYGSADVLRVEHVEKPTPGDNEVLVKVRAAAANPMDCHLMSGVYLMRLMSGLRKPKMTRPGADLAGEVESVGRNVTLFKPGDAVFGCARGSFAEYVCAREDKLALKPANISFEQAAAIPVAGLTALQELRDKGRVQPGQKVLINGAAGGVGTFAVQIAKSFGADVTGVCSTKSVDLVRSLGANRVIDYTRGDFTQSGDRYDLIFDCAGNLPLSAWRRIMTAKGVLLACGARPGGHVVGPLPQLLGLLVSRAFISQTVILYVAKVRGEDLNVLKKMVEARKVTPVIDKSYKFSEATEAIRYLKAGHTRGKVVITLQ